jgi:hypothetical protein
MKNNKLSQKRMKQAIVWFALVVFLAGSAVALSSSYAQARKVKGEWILPKHYPDGFDGYGRIDMIGEKELVADDIPLKLAYNVDYYTPTSEYASKKDFKVHDLVAYDMNEQGEIVALYLIKKAKR